MSLYEELVNFTYVDGKPDGTNYCCPCNRYISYSKKFSKDKNISIDNPSLYEYVYTFFRVLKQEYPNADDESGTTKTSDKAKEELYRFADQFVEDNGNIFSCFSKNANSDHYIGQYINTYHSKLKSEITTYNSCTDYYSNYDSSLSVCNLCHFSAGKFKINSHEHEEELLLRLLVLNKHNFNLLKPIFAENLEKIFACVIDLHSGLKPLEDPLYPFIFPIYQEYVRAIFSLDIDIDSVDVSAVSSSIANTIFDNAPLVSRNNYSAATKKLLETIIRHLTARLFEERDMFELSSDELALLEAFLKEIVEDVSSLDKLATSFNCSFESVEESPSEEAEDAIFEKEINEESDDNYIPPQDFIPGIEDVRENSDDENVPSDDDLIASQSFDEVIVPNDIGLEDATIEDKTPSVETITSSDNPLLPAVSTPTQVVSTSDLDAEASEETVNSENMSDGALHMDESLLNNEPVDVTCTETPVIEKKAQYSSVVHGLSDKDFIIDNTFDNVESYAEHLTNSTAWMFFENTVLSDRFMSVEALHTSDKKDFLLFWGRGRKCFFFLYMTDANVLEMIKPYLTRNQYIKVSYQPYHIYSFGRKYDIEVKRVFSIQTCYSFLNNGTPLLSYEETINSFCIRKMNDKMDDGYPMLLAGMKMYPYICSQCNRMLKDSGTLAKMDAYVDYDEAISRSYYIDSLYENSQGVPAFQLVGANAYYFPQIERGKVRTPGRYFNFQIGEGYESYEAKRVIVGVITYLAEKGRFRKCNIYLCDITDMTVKFFIPEYYVKYFETLFSRIFTDIAKEKVGKKLKLLLHEDTAEVVQKPKDPSFNEFFADEFMNS